MFLFYLQAFLIERLFSCKITMKGNTNLTENLQQLNTEMVRSDIPTSSMVIIKNPTIDSKPQKASYEPVLSDSDGTLDANTTEEINSFLDTFFKLYHTATEKELSYYVSNQALDVINKETKVTQLSQFELTLQKNDNWKIIME